MELRIPHDHLVVVAGPSATGKSTLAGRVRLEAPTEKVAVIAADELAWDALMACDDLCDAMRYMVASVVGEMKAAYQEGAFVVLDTPCSSLPELVVLFSLVDALGVKKPVTLVKMRPDFERQVEYARRRGDLAWLGEDYLRQRYDEFAGAVSSSVRAEIPWVLNEYLVTEPEDVQLKFVW